MNKLGAESGFQLMSRFNNRPSLLHLDDILFPDGPNPGDIIQISGKSGVGKSLLLLKFLSKCLLPKDYNGVDLGGLNSGAILIDTGAGNLILKLVCLMEKFITAVYQKNASKEEYKPLGNLSVIENIIKKCLRNLVVLKTYNSEQLEINSHSIEKILMTDSNISIIIIHSLTSYYWSEVTNLNSIKNMDLYLKSKIQLFLKYAEEYENIVIFSTQEYFQNKQNDFSSFLIKTKIDLKKCEDSEKYLACIDSQKIHEYTVTNSGLIWIN